MKCIICGSKLERFLDLGEQYLSDFRDDLKRPPTFPLEAAFCPKCYLVQLTKFAPRKLMYHENYGFKSGINEQIVKDLDDVVLQAFQYRPDPKSWLDIGSNDGTLLSFVPQDVYRVGVDPVSFLCLQAEQHADVIINDYFDDTVGGEYDVITSISCFYDMPDPLGFVRDVESILAKHGVWIIQQNYLLTTMQLGAIDNFCHEHLTYFTLLSLEKLLARFGLEVNDVYLSSINGGSIRTVVSRMGEYYVEPSVREQRKIETASNLRQLETYQEFALGTDIVLNELLEIVRDLKRQDKRIAILAASTRGSTIWQVCGFGPKEIDYAIERNPQKVGKRFSAIDVPIVSEEYARQNKPDYMIVGPWFFGDSIIDREKEYLDNGGKLIIPLPEVQIIGKT